MNRIIANLYATLGVLVAGAVIMLMIVFTCLTIPLSLVAMLIKGKRPETSQIELDSTCCDSLNATDHSG